VSDPRILRVNNRVGIKFPSLEGRVWVTAPEFAALVAEVSAPGTTAVEELQALDELLKHFDDETASFMHEYIERRLRAFKAEVKQ
jgi:hypothetical protein